MTGGQLRGILHVIVLVGGGPDPLPAAFSPTVFREKWGKKAQPGAMILGYFFSVTRLPFEFAAAVSALPVNRYVIILAIVVVVMLRGCLMDSLAIVLLTVPVFYPLVLQLGFDPIWFGIIVVRVTEMGLITPPVGLNVFVIHGITKVPMSIIF